MDEIIALAIPQLDAVRIAPQLVLEQQPEMQIDDARHRKETLMELYKLHVGRHSY